MNSSSRQLPTSRSSEAAIDGVRQRGSVQRPSTNPSCSDLLATTTPTTPIRVVPSPKRPESKPMLQPPSESRVKRFGIHAIHSVAVRFLETTVVDWSIRAGPSARRVLQRAGLHARGRRGMRGLHELHD